MHNTGSELYNKLLGIYFDESDAERKKNWIENINLKSYLLKDIIIMTGTKM